jgi:D-beta-D-heptose 7-phosphate kinase/D-beta-D-heptose 1-phosphate adenosyltransferase
MQYHKLISRFRRKSILVIGDIILDHYIWGRVNRISPEAPVPVVEVTRESFMLGGAANVAHNIVALGGRAAVVGLRGNDPAGGTVVEMLLNRGITCDGLFTDDRPTTVKTRVIAHNQQVVRFDREDSNYAGAGTLRTVLDHVISVVERHDAVIISDYRKGMITGRLIRLLLQHPLMKKMFVAVDPKVGHFGFYRGVSLITPNVLEASSGSGIEIKDEASLLRAGRALLGKLGCRAVLITRGEQGMSLFERRKVSHIPTVARKVYDVTGAGDTVISAFTLAFAAGATMEGAAVIANHAAGVVVGEVGTTVATPERVIASFS